MSLIYTVILFCIPAIVLSWILPQKYHMIPSTIITTVFLIFFSPLSLAVLSVSSLLGFVYLKYVKNSRIAAFLSAGTSLLMLVVYKIHETNLFDGVDLGMIGLSYYAFRQMHVAIEFYNRSLRTISFRSYLNYLFFLPTFIVGPINTMNDFEKDRLKRRIDPELFSAGLERVLYGLVKVSFLGNYLFSYKMKHWLSNYHNVEEISDLTYHYLHAIRFTGNAYLQFSGYSDVAIGLSALFGYRIIENFNYPFISTNIADFWRRWHISLSTWCRQYIFLPLMAKTRSIGLALIASMLVLGIWHDISWKYFLWAIIQGLALVVWNFYKESRLHLFLDRFRWNGLLSWFINLNFVVISFYILSFDSWSQYLTKILSLF